MNSNLSGSTGSPAGASQANDFTSQSFSSPEKWAVIGIENMNYIKYLAEWLEAS